MLTVLSIVMQMLPMAIQGVQGAVEVIQVAAEVFKTMEDEGRVEPTDEEIAKVRSLRARHYPDFFADDERG